MARHLMLNGEILPTDKPCILHNNRGLLYGDSFSFELRGNSCRAFIIDKYFDYMISVIKSMQMDRPILLRKSVFLTDLELLLQKNRIYKGFKALVTVFRNSSPGKLSYNNDLSVLISVEPCETEYYELNKTGLKIDILNNFTLQSHWFSANKNPFYVKELLSGKIFAEQEIDDAIIMTENSNLAKTILSELFFVKDGILIVPEHARGDYHQIFRDFIVETAKNIKIQSVKMSIKQSDIIEMDEIFTADIISGIKWFIAYKERRYYSKTVNKILNGINERLM